MGFGDAFEQCLAFLEIGGGFGDAIAIFGDTRLARGGGGLLLRDRGAFVGGEQLVDQHGGRGARPSQQHGAGGQRDALLPEGADPQTRRAYRRERGWRDWEW